MPPFAVAKARKPNGADGRFVMSLPGSVENDRDGSVEVFFLERVRRVVSSNAEPPGSGNESAPTSKSGSSVVATIECVIDRVARACVGVDVVRERHLDRGHSP